MTRNMKGLEFFEPELLEDCGLESDPQLDLLEAYRISIRQGKSLIEEIRDRENSLEQERDKDPLVLP